MKQFKFNMKENEVRKANELLGNPFIKNHKNIEKDETLMSFSSKIDDKTSVELSVFTGEENILASLYLDTENNFEEYQEDIISICQNDTYKFTVKNQEIEIIFNLVK